MNPKLKPNIAHLLDLKNLTKDCITYILNRADHFKSFLDKKSPIPQYLSGKKIISLFFEPSTRTQFSFEIAAKNLGATTLCPVMSNLSCQKGESLLDTFFSFEAMGVDLFIIRHEMNNTPHFIADELKTNTHIINAGDGTSHHPSQALIDLFTIKKRFHRLDNLNVSIIGDIDHSRVAKSLIRGLSVFEGNKITLIGPPELTQSNFEYTNTISVTPSLKEGLNDADVIVCLRIQKERIPIQQHPSESVFYEKYAITQNSLKFANPEAILLHPGPINRGIEIDSTAADGIQSQLLNQVQNSIPMRMTILELLLDS